MFIAEKRIREEMRNSFIKINALSGGQKCAVFGSRLYEDSEPTRLSRAAARRVSRLKLSVRLCDSRARVVAKVLSSLLGPRPPT